MGSRRPTFAKPRLAIAVVAAAVLLAATTATASGLMRLAGKGVVVGGLQPCAGIVTSNSPRYAAGTVTVLRGDMAWRDAGNGVTAAVFPAVMAGRQVVGTNGIYVFVLDPGEYVLEGEYTAGGGEPEPWVEVTITSGSVAHVDIPNMCL